MKKLLALVLVLALTVCLFAACDKKEEVSVDATAEVRPLAEEALELVVKRDQDALLSKLTDSDVKVDPAKSLVNKLKTYAKVTTEFEAQVDTWKISDELKAEVKEYAKTKVDTLFAAEGVKDITALSEVVVSVEAKAKMIDTAAAGYKEFYTAEGNYAKFVGEEKDADALAKIKTMEIDALKVVVDNIFAELQAYVVDTDVAFQFKKIGNDWKIGNVGISVA